MNKLKYFLLDYYDRKVIERIIEKYDYSPMEATREFIKSETHLLLEDADYGMIDFSERAIFDIWEAEKITGDPRNSLYIRG